MKRLALFAITPMDKQTLKQFKKKLLVRKERIEKELATIAEKDKKNKGDYDTKFPDFGITQSPDESALRVVDYERTLPLEYALELRLAEVNKALEKIDLGSFGQCEKCGQPINLKRLEIMPEAKFCMKCQKR